MNTSPRLLDCVREFLLDKRREGLARATLASYERALNLFMETPGLPECAGDLQPKHARFFTTTLLDPDRLKGPSEFAKPGALKPGAVNAYQRPVWVFFRWLLDQEYLEVDIPKRVKRFKVEESEITRRTVSGTLHEDLLTKARNRAEHALRNVALIEVLWYSGLRRSEVAALDLADVDLDNGLLFVRRGKGGKPRRVGLDTEACLAVSRYLSKDRGRAPGPLFLSRTGQRLSAAGIHCMLRALCRDEAFTARAHDFRRACAANLRKAGLDIAHTMHQLGHTKTEMTLIYSASGEEEAALSAYHALSSSVRPLHRKAR